MSTPIGDMLGPVEHFAERITDATITDVQRVWRRVTAQHPYDATEPPKGATMSLATTAADMRADLGSLQTNAQADYNRLKTALEEKLPEVERIGALIDSDPLVQLALGDLVPAPLRQLAADTIGNLVKAFQAQPAPATSAEATPEQPAA